MNKFFFLYFYTGIGRSAKVQYGAEGGHSHGGYEDAASRYGNCAFHDFGQYGSRSDQNQVRQSSRIRFGRLVWREPHSRISRKSTHKQTLHTTNNTMHTLFSIHTKHLCTFAKVFRRLMALLAAKHTNNQAFDMIIGVTDM